MREDPFLDVLQANSKAPNARPASLTQGFIGLLSRKGLASAPRATLRLPLQETRLAQG